MIIVDGFATVWVWEPLLEKQMGYRMTYLSWSYTCAFSSVGLWLLGLVDLREVSLTGLPSAVAVDSRRHSESLTWRFGVLLALVDDTPHW